MHTPEAKVYLTLLIAASVTIIVVLYFIISILRQHRRVLKLQQEKMTVELLALEQERKRIAADLHDELGPLLSSVRLQIGCIDTPSDEVVVQKASEHIDTILKRLREIANGLMPQVLLRKGLIVALEEYTGGISNAGALRISFSAPPVLPLSDVLNVHLFRLVQEITHNALKYAAANVLEITLTLAADTLQLVIRDNGKGFDTAAVLKEGKGLGLLSIARRTELLQGHFYLESRPGDGTCYTFEIPLTKNA